MKLLFDAERLRNPHSGLGQFCRAMGDALLRHREPGDEVTFVVPPAQVELFGPGASYKPVAWWQRYWSPANVDVWHATHQDAWIRPSRGARVVLTIMDLNFLERRDYSSARKARRLAAVQRKIDRASAVATISAYTASVVREHLRITDIPLSVIHLGNPVEAANAPPIDVPAPLSLRALGNGPFFLFVGVLHPKKNVHTLVPLLGDFPGWRLVLAGPDDHPYAREVREQARALGLGDRLVMPGAVDESTKRWLYANCRALLFPSLSEGFGLPVVEAMGFGKPVFLSRLTSLPEIGGSTAWYFDSFARESMVAVVRRGLDDFAAHPERTAGLLEAASRFSWDRAATEYWLLYDEARRAPPR